VALKKLIKYSFKALKKLSFRFSLINSFEIQKFKILEFFKSIVNKRINKNSLYPLRKTKELSVSILKNFFK